jgi:hypothetical protein
MPSALALGTVQSQFDYTSKVLSHSPNFASGRQTFSRQAAVSSDEAGLEQLLTPRLLSQRGFGF